MKNNENLTQKTVLSRRVGLWAALILLLAGSDSATRLQSCDTVVSRVVGRAVVEGADGMPDLSVTLLSLSNGGDYRFTATDKRGSFEFLNVRGGFRYQIRVAKILLADNRRYELQEDKGPERNFSFELQTCVPQYVIPDYKYRRLP